MTHWQTVINFTNYESHTSICTPKEGRYISKGLIESSTPFGTLYCTSTRLMRGLISCAVKSRTLHKAKTWLNQCLNTIQYSVLQYYSIRWHIGCRMTVTCHVMCYRMIANSANLRALDSLRCGEWTGLGLHNFQGWMIAIYWISNDFSQVVLLFWPEGGYSLQLQPLVVPGPFGTSLELWDKLHV